MAHWPVNDQMIMRVLTGLWKLCARMRRRRVSDKTSDEMSDAAHAWLSTKFVGSIVGRIVGLAILHLTLQQALQFHCLLFVSQWYCSCTEMVYATVRGVILACHIRVNEAVQLTVALWSQCW